MSQVTKYDLQVTDCKLSQVINATELDSGRAGVDCLNVKFSAKSQVELRQSNFYPTAFLGSGLYALSFNDELIYLGSYLGSGNGGAFFTGNLLRSRIWAHIGSITMRGHRVNMSSRQLEKLVETFGDKHPLIQTLSKAPDPGKLHRAAGCLAPLKRMVFCRRSLGYFPLDNFARFTQQISTQLCAFVITTRRYDICTAKNRTSHN